MIEFILNDEQISTQQPPGMTVLDFARYHKDLKGTKIGCREGDCGACTILVGELVSDQVKYRSMTSCLMPLANAAGKHIVTIEGINPKDGSLTPVQQAMVDESGTQCGFCTVGFVMSLTGFCLDPGSGSSVSRRRVSSPHVSKGSSELRDSAISSIDGNICRCTGYKSIERAAEKVCAVLSEPSASAGGLERLSEPPALAGGTTDSVNKLLVPEYFSGIAERLTKLSSSLNNVERRQLTHVALTGGGTDLYVQRPEEMAETVTRPLLYDDELRGVRDLGEYIDIGASSTVTDLMVSPIMQAIFPDLYKHLKLISSTPIRNMATLAGNFVNASPIGDMTVWFLALDAEIRLTGATSISLASPQSGDSVHSPTGRGSSATGGVSSPTVKEGSTRIIKLRDLYLGYKQLDKQTAEIITAIRFKKPTGDFRFNFEKISKRTYLDIATVNSAISLERRHLAGESTMAVDTVHISAGGVAPIPLYLKQTSEFLRGKEINEETISAANEIMQSEISPISDVRGTEQYKRLLLRQLFRAHFVELFATEITEKTEGSPQ